MNKYDSYKDSGVEWIGEIPSDWIISKFKYQTKLPVQYGINSSSDNYVESGTRFIRTTDIINIKELKDGGVYLDENTIEETYFTNKYDFLVSRSGTLGRTYIHLSDERYTYGGYLVRFNFGEYYLTKFLGYFSKTKSFDDWIELNTIVSTIGNVNGQKYNNLPFPLPPIQEQQQIVSFLDNKTLLIDSLIEKTQKKIELLKEKRTSLINHTVIKGLNHNVEMKDSGVELIGEIPKHWKFTKIKYFLNDIIDTEHKTVPFFDDGKYYVIRTSNIRNGEVVFKKMKMTNEDGFKNWTRRGVPELGDVLLTREGPVGECCIVPSDIKFCMGQRVVWLQVKKNLLNPKFLLHTIYCKHSKIFMDTISIGSTLSHLNMSEIGNIPITVCSIEEQQQIVDYLDEQTNIIDTTITKEQKRTKLLKEYRQSLISEVVTGKIKVCD